MSMFGLVAIASFGLVVLNFSLYKRPSAVEQ